MEQLFTIHRAANGQRRTQSTRGGVDLYLPALAINQLWQGMKQVDPALADLLKTNPIIQLLMEEAGARPSLTSAQLQDFNAAGEGAAQ